MPKGEEHSHEKIHPLLSAYARVYSIFLDAEIRKILDQWAKAFHAKDLNGIMAIYEPGDALVSYDIVPPLQYSGYEAYKKDYQEFLDQFQGPVDIEYRNLKIVAGDTVAFSRGLERMTGTLKSGQKFDAWPFHRVLPQN